MDSLNSPASILTDIHRFSEISAGRLEILREKIGFVLAVRDFREIWHMDPLFIDVPLTYSRGFLVVSFKIKDRLVC